MIERKWAIIFLSLFILLIGGCANKIHEFKNVGYNKSLSLSTKDKKLVERFLQYWHYRIIGDRKKAWKMELPYQRYRMSFSIYNAQVQDYRGCVVKLKRIDYKSPYVAIVKRVVLCKDKKGEEKLDKWIYIEGEWYHKFYQNVFPPQSVEEFLFQ